MKKLLIVVYCLVATVLSAQNGVFGGLTMVKAVGLQGVYPGMHVGIEIPKDNEVSFFVRASGTLRNTYEQSIYYQAIDPMTSPSLVMANTQFKSGYFNIDGGTRYYIGDGYDSGFAFYGGTIFMLSTTGIKRKAQSDYDLSKYEFVDATNIAYAKTGRIYSLNLGLNAGVKKQVGIGMVYLDVVGAYSIFAVGSNSLASDFGTYSRIIFNVSVGYRRNLY